MVNVWIHVYWKIRAAIMQFVEFQNIVYFAYAQMVSVVNQQKPVHNPNVQLIAIVKLKNDVKLAHAEIHVYKRALVVLMHNVV